MKTGLQANAVGVAAGSSMAQSTFLNREEGSSGLVVRQRAAKRRSARFFIQGLSSVNLRGESGEFRRLKKPMEFVCTVCKRKMSLGKTCGSYTRIVFDGFEERLCDACTDVFAEVVRKGPMVMVRAFEWELTTMVLRMSAVEKELQCQRCMAREESHIFFKFRDIVRAERRRNGLVPLKVSAVGESMEMRCCSVCAMSFIDSMRRLEVSKEYAKR